MIDIFSAKLYYKRKLKGKKKEELKEDEYIKEEIINHYEKCGECKNGFVIVNNSPKLCNNCLGSGRVLVRRERVVKSKKE